MHRHAWYQAIYERIPEIHADACKARSELRCDELRGEVGLYSGQSSCPGHLPEFVTDAIREANRTAPVGVRAVEDEIRSEIKDLYGDDYDCAVTNTCEAGLRAAVEALMAPPIMRRGEMYRARLMAPLTEDYEWAAAYGRPFPPKYKNIASDRSVSAGEFGMDAKCLSNVDTVFVRCPGARYEVHGIRQNIVPILVDLDVGATAQAMETAARRHAGELSGVLAIGYDTPGYGQTERDEHGVPMLLRELGACARRYDVPFLVDCASCVPGIGLAPRAIGADVMVWSMDKVGRAPTSGLLVGTSEAMLVIRRALGIGGLRHGHVSSHGKAVMSLADPGRDALIGVLASLRRIKADPDRFRRPVHALHAIVMEELEALPSTLRAGLIVTPSEHLGGVEINYARTWSDGSFGIPMFTLEDSYVDINPICSAMEQMGVAPPSIYGGNILMTPNYGLLDPADGTLLVERARVAVRALVQALLIVCRHAKMDLQRHI